MNIPTNNKHTKQQHTVNYKTTDATSKDPGSSAFAIIHTIKNTLKMIT